MSEGKTTLAKAVKYECHKHPRSSGRDVAGHLVEDYPKKFNWRISIHETEEAYMVYLSSQAQKHMREHPKTYYEDDSDKVLRYTLISEKVQEERKSKEKVERFSEEIKNIKEDIKANSEVNYSEQDKELEGYDSGNRPITRKEVDDCLKENDELKKTIKEKDEIIKEKDEIIKELKEKYAKEDAKKDEIIKELKEKDAKNDEINKEVKAFNEKTSGML